MTLEFTPEIEESLKARYPKALTAIVGKYEVESLSEDFREHIFDFYDGLRLVISKEPTKLYSMISYIASMQVEMEFDDSIEFAAFVLEHINILRDKPITGMVNMTYERGTLYLSVPEHPINAKLN